jgi:pyridinium-3,5-bisthiocarboxylic acid mononucleotide nickel chelatase
MFQMAIQEFLDVAGENSDCSRGRAAQRFDGMCTLPYDENQSLVLLSADQQRTTNDRRQVLMRIAYLDCFSGVSGDMFMGALIDAGVSRQLLEETVAALNIGARLEISRVRRNGISATKVDVYSRGEKDLPREICEPDAGKSEHSHHGHSKHSEHEHNEHAHSHAHHGEPVALLEHNYALQGSPTSHKHDHSHSLEHGRGLKEIRGIIRQAAISESAKQTAISIFEALGAAEAKIHDSPIEKIHFHEVGAVDALVDIVCAAVGSEALGVDEIVCSPLNVGGGTVNCAHGTLPVPAPATLELLGDTPVCSSSIQAELVTPTGAAIIKILVNRFASFPGMKVEKTGYGAGSRDFAGHANVVRITIGEAQSDLSSELLTDTVVVLEANLDDLNPQVFGYVMDRLLEDGALDAFGVPVQMKKNRPGTLLTVLCRAEDASKLTHLIFTETTTLGVRQREEKRQTLDRKWITIATRWGDVRLKIASMNGMETNCSPEYEDCRRIAAERRIPLKSVMQEAMQIYLNRPH